jgi:AbiV family abortive infection protein
MLAASEQLNIKIAVQSWRDRIIIVSPNETELLRAYLTLDTSRIDVDVFSRIIQSPIMTNALRLFTLAINGDLNMMKNQALYVDVNTDGQFYSPEKEITADKAQSVLEMCSHASDFLRTRIFFPPNPEQ